MSPARTFLSSDDVVSLERGWQAAWTEPGREAGPEALDGLSWLAAAVPGTAAGALRDAGARIEDLDDRDWWFRTAFEAAPLEPGEEIVLVIDGIATIADVYLNGEHILHSVSMFQSHTVDVGARLRAHNALAVHVHALGPELDKQRRPRAKWRTRLVADNNLRWFRTMLLGRIPSFSPGPAAVGPWRPIRLVRRRRIALDDLAVTTRLDAADGILTVGASIRPLGGGPPVRSATATLVDPAGRAHRATGSVEPSGHIALDLRIPDVERWWPHTHGLPSMYDLTVEIDDGTEPVTIRPPRVGFRTLAPGPVADHDIDREGLAIHVNGAPIFVRGALWTPLDVVDMGATPGALRAALEAVRAAGMNMLRLPGFGPYEQDAFHDLCDELGILVWQDLMFASMDYPFEDEGFARAASDEVETVVARLRGRPSSTVLCGNSEVEQQVAMLGLDIGLARIPFYDSTVPEIAIAAGLDAIYVPSAPFGGDMPMRPLRGVTNYYGVGGYRFPLSDARSSGVRFAAECLAFANIPDDEALASLVPEPPGEAFVHHPRWKAGVARDAGAGWDFDDLRDHYLEAVFGVDPGWLRRGDPDRYLELSRAVTGEVMASVFGEWRRAESPSGGGLILWLRDLVPGAGYGVVDDRGHPKTAYYHLRRALAPTAVWLIDEGIGGVIAHVANDGPTDLVGRLRVALYTDLELRVASGDVPLNVPPRSAVSHDVETVIGHFVDAAWAYRFGPPAHDAIVVTLERAEGDGWTLASQAFHFPAGRPLHVEPERRLGLSATSRRREDGTLELTVESRRLAYGVRIHAPGYAPTDDAFSVEPGGARVVDLQPRSDTQDFRGGTLTALNLVGRVPITPGAPD